MQRSVQRSAFSLRRKTPTTLKDRKTPIQQSAIGNLKKSRLGLFGGAFNPIHFGHLRAALEIQEAFSLGRILFIPTAVPPHKNSRNLIPFAHRMKMIRLALDRHPILKVSDIEKKRAGKSYTIETVRYFKESLGSRVELFFIVGMDAFLEVETWKSYHNLFKLCHFIVMKRPGYQQNRIKEFIFQKISRDMIYVQGENRFYLPGEFSIFLFPVTLIDISSTVIRRLRQANQSIHYLLPEKVERYILEKNFYAAQTDY